MKACDRETLFEWRDNYVQLYERGLTTASECSNALLSLLVESPNDEICLELCAGLPGWYRTAFLTLLDDFATSDYYRRSFGIGDARTEEQVHHDALHQQELLRRLVLRMKDVLQLRHS
jgi:hypothetical protein